MADPFKNSRTLCSSAKSVAKKVLPKTPTPIPTAHLSFQRTKEPFKKSQKSVFICEICGKKVLPKIRVKKITQQNYRIPGIRPFIPGMPLKPRMSLPMPPDENFFIMVWVCSN